MSNEIEIQYINTQMNANNFILNNLESDILQLLNIVHQKRNTIRELKDYNKNLNDRLTAINTGNNNIILIDYFPIKNNEN